MKNKSNICILGVGGVGGFFGGKIARVLGKGHDTNLNLNLYFIARGKHLEEIKRNGLILNTAEESSIICKPTLATDNVEELPFIDVCLLCVKSYDLEKASESLKKRIKKDTIIIPLLNGVDIYERIKMIINDGIVFPACVYVGTHIEKPGVVTQKGGSCIITFGPDPNNSLYMPHNVFDIFNKSEIKYNWVSDPYPAIWEKYIFISSFGLVSAGFNKTMGEIMKSKELKEYVLSIMREIESIAKKKEIHLANDIAESSLEKGNNFPYETKTSFQRDVEYKDKQNEGDLFGGTIIRLGKMLGIQTPNAEFIYNRILSQSV